MPQQTKVFRVFVSSTFTDMKEERRILQKDVFPRLEKLCESNQAKFQAVDLRWGVNPDTALNQQTLELCLNEIDRCQRLSPKPNFLILIGNKYGWQPIPSRIPQDEMDEIQKVLTLDEKELVDKWYWLDKNAILQKIGENTLHEFVLQPKGNDDGEYDIWNDDEHHLQILLRKAVSLSSFSPDKKVKYFASATHQEIIRGAINPWQQGQKPEEHVMAFIRDISGFKDSLSQNGFIDKNDRAYCTQQLKSIRTELHEILGGNCHHLSARWENGKSQLNDPQYFSDTVYEFLKDIIQSQLAFIELTDDIEHEANLHKQFMNRLNEHFQGRDNILNTIQKYIENTADKKVLSLIGDSGTGKSSVMAQAIKLNTEKRCLLVFRFIGTTSKSSTIESLLNSICNQISEGYGMKLETLAGEGKEKSLHEMQGLTEIFRKCLGLASAEKPLIVFLDALDQLSEAGKIRSLYWLPRELPDHVKIIISCLTELEKDVSFTHVEHLPVLTEGDARQILNSWFDTARRALTEAQFKIILDNFKRTNGQVIYLKLAFEIAKEWQSYDQNIVLKEDVAGIINDYFDWLEDEHTKELVTNVICYMLCGRYEGLAENEILELLVFDKDYWEKVFLPNSFPEHRKDLEGVTKIPTIVWSRLFLDLEPFLTEKDADGVPIITFFHRQFNKVLKERYKLVEENINS